MRASGGAGLADYNVGLARRGKAAIKKNASWVVV
jgi:hypothetical protein